MKHLIDPTDLSKQEIDGIITLAEDMIAHRDKYRDCLRYHKLATLFYEPSTRTRLSFTAAMMELGGNVLGFSDARNSSVINAGDGSHAHPTQTLTDLLTIKRELGRIDGITIGFCGDLKFGRTVHSLIKALSRYENVKVVLIAPDELRLPDYIKSDVCDRQGISCREVRTIEEVIGELDVLYMTRVQKERFLDEEEFERVKDSFVLDNAKMALAREKMCVLHPLPRVNEIKPEVDSDPRAAYFRQVGNGKFVRMALIYSLIMWKDDSSHTMPDHNDRFEDEGLECCNSKCISNHENVPRLFHRTENGAVRCVYCDSKVR